MRKYVRSLILEAFVKRRRTSQRTQRIQKTRSFVSKVLRGGLFSEIAGYVIRSGGVVFGAAFDDSFAVRHVYVETIEDLRKLRGSKYVQSSIGNVYGKAEQFLNAGRLVLFTGTPCQIGGLYNSLKKEYDNLVTQDIICHGVPSPLVWKKYVNYRESTAGSKVRRTFFRHKKYGWKTYSVRFEFVNRTEYEDIFQEDLFMRGFFADLCLRPSCYNCSFKNRIRQSDFTLADFWGIENILPQMDDDKGTSLVFVNSKKAENIFHQMAGNIEWQKVDKETAIRNNPNMIKSARMSRKRDTFMRQVAERDFREAVDRNAIRPSLLCRCYGKMKGLIIKHLKK